VLACYVMARCFDVSVLPSIIGVQWSIILFGPLAFLLIVYQAFWINPGIAVVYAGRMFLQLARRSDVSRRAIGATMKGVA